MLIDFTPVEQKTIKLGEFAQQFSVEDLRRATNASLDLLRSIIDQTDDRHIAFDPLDPKADDPHAIEGEEKIGWSLGHLVAHVTATSEESAAVASVLARGIAYPREPRLRYETPWRDISTKSHAVQRLEESRRIRLGYLAAFPDHPFFDLKQDISERALEMWGDINARTRFLLGLYHEWQHYDQFRDVLGQALAAHPVTA
ncbi:MAG: DinB family protein [bacterium]|nr:DinB family protein [bacterium]